MWLCGVGASVRLIGADAATITPKEVPLRRHELGVVREMAYSTEASTLDDLMRRIVEKLLVDGERNVASKGETIEIVSATLELTNPRARISRTETRRKVVSALGELCWYLSGSNEADPVLFYISEYAKAVEPDGTIHGAYGPRLFGQNEGAQVDRVIQILRQKPSSRQAVIQLFDRADIASPGQYLDIPCTTTLQFLLRSNSLHMIVNMRSNDAYWGLPHDVFAFTMIQEIVARELGAEVGRYIHSVGSIHLYTNKLDLAKQFIGEGWQSTVDYMPTMSMGSQFPHIRQLLDAESQLRAGVPFSDIELPQDPYWADLAHLLAIRAAQKFNWSSEIRANILAGFTSDAYAEFL